MSWITWTIIISLFILTIFLMFYTERKIYIWWLRLPVVNLLLYMILLFMMFGEEVYLTFHSDKRTPSWEPTSIRQRFFR